MNANFISAFLASARSTSGLMIYWSWSRCTIFTSLLSRKLRTRTLSAFQSSGSSFSLHVIENTRPLPPGTNKNRLNYINHGGVAVISIAGVAVTKVNSTPCVKTFEHLCCWIICRGAFIILATKYRPGSELLSLAFFKELTLYLSFSGPSRLQLPLQETSVFIWRAASIPML